LPKFIYLTVLPSETIAAIDLDSVIAAFPIPGYEGSETVKLRMTNGDDITVESDFETIASRLSTNDL
jgi:hypothetical protein